MLKLMLILVLTVASYATSVISYSGRVTNSDGSPVTGAQTIRFELVYSGSTGVIRCDRTYSGVPLANGVFQVEVDFNGAGTCVGTFQDVLLNVPGGESLAVIVTVDPLGTPKVYPTQNVVAVPYAVHADVASTVIDNAIDSNAILDGAVTLAKIDPSTCADGEVIKRSGGVWTCGADNNTGTTYTAAAPVDITGTVISLNSGGVSNTYLGADSVTTDKIAVGAVGNTDLATDSVDSAKIINGSIATDDLTNGAVTTAKLGALAVTGAELAGDAVTSAKIANGTIVAADIDNTSVQQRVSGACAAGSAINTINADGTVTCEADDNTGEVNTASNAGGISLVLTKSGVDLPFRGLESSDSSVGIATTATTIDLTVDVTGTSLTGLGAGTDAAILGSDNILVAMAKLQAQISGNNSDIAGITPSQWTTSGSDIYFNSGNVGVGTDAPSSQLHILKDIAFNEGTIHAESNSGFTEVLSTGYGSGSGSSGAFYARLARGTKTTPAAIENNDNIGGLGWRGYNGSAWTGSKAYVLGFASENWTPTANGTRLTFATTPNGSTSALSRVVIRESGNVGIGVDNPQDRLDISGNVRASSLAGSGDRCLQANNDGVISLAAGTCTTGGSGEVNTASSLGGTASIVGTKSGVNIPFRGISSADSSITVTENANDISLVVPDSTVTAATLSSFLTGADSTVTNSDTVEVAIEKLQGQIDGNNTALAGIAGAGTGANDLVENSAVPNCTADEKLEISAGPLYNWSCVSEDDPLDNVLSGFVTGADSTVLNTDSLEVAIEKLQGQIDGNNTDLSGITSSQWTTSGSDIYYNSGNVGIGTSSPDVRAVIASGALCVSSDANCDGNTNTEGQIHAAELCDETGANCNDISAGFGGGGDNLGNHTATQDIDLGTYKIVGNGGTIGLDIDSTGRVGIGVTPPTQSLQVDGLILSGGNLSGTSGTAGLIANSSASRATLTLLNTNSGSNQATDGSQIAHVFNRLEIINRENDAMTFKTNNTEAMRIDATGNVGIGTSNPITDLDVYSAGGIRTQYNSTGGILGSFHLDGENSAAAKPNQSRWSLYNFSEYGGATGLSFYEYYDADDDGNFCDDTGACDARLFLQEGGNVGIGTTNPSALLDVNGIIRATQLCDEAGANCKDISAGWAAGGAGSEASFYAYNSSSQALGTSFGAVSFDSTSYNIGSGFSTATGRFTPSVAGKYLIIAYSRMSAMASGQGGVLSVDKNGSAAARDVRYSSITSTSVYPVVTRVVEMNGTTDYLSVSAYATNTGKVMNGGENETFFQGYLLSPSGGGSADDLGNHTATTNLQIGANYISNDGDAEGISIDAAGNVTFSGTITGDGSGLTNISTSTSDLSTINLAQGSDRTLDVDRATSGAGNNLSISSGGAQSGSTDQNGGDLVLSSGVSTGSGSSSIQFKTNPAGSTGTTDTTPTTAMTILGNGNVGIGTTNPAAKLDVNGGIRATEICDESGANCKDISSGWSGGSSLTGATGSSNTHLGVGTSGGTAGGGGFNNVAMGVDALDVNTGNLNTAIGRDALVRNTSGGSNTAIGALTLTRVETTSNSTGLGYYALYNATGGNNTALGSRAGDSITTGTDNILIGYNVDTPTATTSNHLNIGNAIYGDLSTGDIGIGTTTPGAKLHVVGDIQYTGVITDISDRRLKENIIELDGALDKVREIETYSFNMIDDENKKLEYGVMAQNIEKVLPDLVRRLNPDEDFLGVNYIGLIPWTIEALKELDENLAKQKLMQNGIERRIASVEAENKELKARVDKLEAENAEIKEKLNQIIKLLNKK